MGEFFMRKSLNLFIMIVLVPLIVPVQSLRSSESDEALKTVRKVVGYVKYSEKKPEYADRALDYLASERISRYLLGFDYEKASPEQRRRFIGYFREYIKLKAFPSALEYIRHIDLSYEKPVKKNGAFHIRSSILYRGSERIEFTWVLEKFGDRFLLTDFLDARGQSSMKSNRDQQVRPILRKKGMDGLLDQFNKVLAAYR